MQATPQSLRVQGAITKPYASTHAAMHYRSALSKRLWRGTLPRGVLPRGVPPPLVAPVSASANAANTPRSRAALLDEVGAEGPGGASASALAAGACSSRSGIPRSVAALIDVVGAGARRSSSDVGKSKLPAAFSASRSRSRSFSARAASPAAPPTREARARARRIVEYQELCSRVL